jgi:hypothetical protein
MTASSIVLDPVAPAAHAPRHEARAVGGLHGKVVGFIDNAKPNFHHLIDDLAELLVARHGVAAIVRHRKRSASIPASREVYADVKEKCDLVISGSGD